MISIVVCTKNRVGSLLKTVEALGSIQPPAGEDVEILVVDNGSNDGTREAIAAFQLHVQHLRYIYCASGGQSRARNVGIASCQGDIILFTDDDVLPDCNWMREMALPLISGKCDAVAGSIELASSLVRPWMDGIHRTWLAAPPDAMKRPVELVGANMGFHRRVLERVPEFEVELGPGALGFADDTLFSDQLKVAGYRMSYVGSASVVHHPEPSRLLRKNWISAAEKRGRSCAFVRHHWGHQSPVAARARALWFFWKLLLRRKTARLPALDDEGCESWEMSYLVSVHKWRGVADNAKLPHKYRRKGLRPISSGGI